MDKRRKLKAHWPPRRINQVQIQLDRETYELIYKAAEANDRSLADEIRARLKDPQHTC